VTSSRSGRKVNFKRFDNIMLKTKTASPLRSYRHRYFGVLAPNLPLRNTVTALTTNWDWDMAVQPVPDCAVDQRTNW